MPGIGIDFGTTYHRVGIWRNGTFEIIPSSTGKDQIPAYIAFTSSGVLIGEAAKKQSAENIENTVFGTKTLVGRRLSSHAVQSCIAQWPFKVIAESSASSYDKPAIRVRHCNKFASYSPGQILSMILADIKQSVEQFIGEEVPDVVITVPGGLNAVGCKTLTDACVAAKLNIVSFIEGSIATAIACGLHTEHRVAVCDSGGGSLNFRRLGWRTVYYRT